MNLAPRCISTIVAAEGLPKGNFHAKMNTIERRNDMDLKEAKEIKKRWQEYAEEL